MIQFLRDSLQQCAAQEWRWLALILLVLVSGTSALLLTYLPDADAMPSAPFIIVAIVRVSGIMLLSVALVRVATGSQRGSFIPDLGFLGYLTLSVIGFAVSGGISSAFDASPEALPNLVIAQMLTAIVSAPLAVWTIALITEQPFAIDPRPWFRKFGQWLPQLLTWYLLIIVPLGAIHAYINAALMENQLARSLFVELADGALSLLILLIGLALSITAYRRVANR